jgi:release factor glutamine methyltransferase
VTTVRDGLAAAVAGGLTRLDAQLLLGLVLDRDRAWLHAHDDQRLTAGQWRQFNELAARRQAGEPFAYIVGQKEFHGLELQVDARVLVPRPDTELLVEWAIELLRGDLAEVLTPEVIDLGTGSGAIALAVRHACPNAQVTATDASADALEVARANATRLGIAIESAAGSWWQAVPARRFHLALSNPPYIAAGDAHLAQLRAEPPAALTPGESGLESLREIAARAPDHLEAGGWLLLEHGFEQGEAVRQLLRSHGFTQVTTRQDLAGQPRCSGGRH